MDSHKRVEQTADMDILVERIVSSAHRANRAMEMLIMAPDRRQQAAMRRFLRQEAWVLVRLAVGLWLRSWR